MGLVNPIIHPTFFILFMKRVVHFEIHAADPERAEKFYRDIFGWEIKEWIIPGVEVKPENRYWTVMTGKEDKEHPSQWPGINGGLVPRRGGEPQGGEPVNAYVCTIDVESVDEYAKKIIGAGGTVTVPKMPVKGMGWLAYFKDTEGNIFGIMENDTSAG